MILLNLETIFSLLIPSKLQQFKLYSQNVKLPDFRENLLAPNSNSELPTYGSITIIFRYGYIGFFTYILIKFLAFNYIIDEKIRNNMTIQKLSQLVPLLFILIYSFKIPQLSIYTDIILLNYYSKNKE